MEPGTRKKTRYVQLAVGIIERTAFAQRSGNGRLAQLGERLPYKQEVGGSIPSPPTRRTGSALRAAIRPERRLLVSESPRDSADPAE
jgi:hypothetical protein